MRYRVDWYKDGARIIDTKDGGVVYADLDTRSATIINNLLNQLAEIEKSAQEIAEIACSLGYSWSE